MDKNKITVEATINADVQKVWNYWTSPEHIVNWNFASVDWHCPSAENDVRTGGKFRSTMASKDGQMSFDFEGVYVSYTAAETGLHDGRWQTGYHYI